MRKGLVIFLALACLLLIPGIVKAVDGWTLQYNSGARDWRDIDSSSDGTKLVAVVFGGYIYTSTDSGVTWTERTGAGSRNWFGVASSSDGTKLVATVQSGYIYTSTDSGATWTEQTNAGSRSWRDIDSSSDGTKLVAVVFGGYIYTSTDSGANWTERTGAGSRNWQPVDSSSDGTKLAVGNNITGYIYTSTDSGASWTERVTSGSRRWESIVSSSDGTKLVATIISGGLYTSTDSGVNWTVQAGAGNRVWRGVASSSDGVNLAGVVTSTGGLIYTSTDSGVNWTAQTDAGSHNWYRVASSSDGTKLAVSTSQDDYIFTYGTVTEGDITTGTASPIYPMYATLTGEVVDAGVGGVSEKGFEYGLTGAYGTTATDDRGFEEGEFSLSVGPLECNTTYHYRAYAVNGFGTFYGDDATFTTSACATPTSTLYGADGAGQNASEAQLYILDPENGDILSTVGTIGFSVTGLAMHPITKVMYGSTGNTDSIGDNNAKSLITIDLDTGLGTLLGVIKTSGAVARGMSDIAFDSAGTLYGFSGSDDNFHIIDIDSCDGSTCLTTPVGDFPVSTFGNGLAVSDTDDIYLFYSGDNYFGIIDPATGLSTEDIVVPNGGIGNGGPVGAADFNENNILYATRTNFGSSPSDLIIVDVDTGSVISLGDNSDLVYMDAIAFYIPPEEAEEVPQVSSSGSRPKKITAQSVLESGVSNPLPPTDCLPTYNYSPSTGVKCPTTTTTDNSVPECVISTTLKLGSRGEEVKCLQTILNILSDGIFGPITKASVINFQKSKNLVPDGIVGPRTHAVIGGN